MPVPRSIAAGSTLLYTETLQGYPASANSLTLALNMEGTSAANIAATASGDAYILQQTAQQTAAWRPAQYFWAYLVTNTATGAVTQVCHGLISITPNFAATATPTAAQLQLAALDTAITALVANPNSSVSFNGQSFTARNLTELFDVRDRLQARVTYELRAAGLTTRGGAQRIATRFGC